jgi:DNA-binding transcriptional LysR family regulator
MIDELRAMAIFREVVEAGSFRAAAKILKLSPSVVSHHVAQLEERLGTALLYRSTRRLSLTHDGATLLAASHQMVDAARSGLAALRKRSGEPSGRLTVAVAGAVFESPPYINHLSAFARAHPKVDMSISFSDQMIDLIGSTFDAAIRIGWLEDSRYKARKLTEIRRALVVSPKYLEGRKAPRTMEDLEGWDWVKLAQVPVLRQLTNKAGESPVMSIRVAIEVDSVAALCRMAGDGMGVACVPRFLIEPQIQDGRLVLLEPDWDLMAPGAYVVWPNNVSDDSLTRHFVDYMVQQVATR